MKDNLMQGTNKNKIQNKITTCRKHNIFAWDNSTFKKANPQQRIKLLDEIL